MSSKEHHYGADGVCNDCSADAGSSSFGGPCPGKMQDGKKLRDVLKNPDGSERKDVHRVPPIAR